MQLTRWLACACMCLLLGAWASPAHAQWTNKPSGFQTVLDCPMNTLAACGIEDQYGGSIATTDSGQTVSPNGAVKSTMPAGASVGGGQWNYAYPLTREIFVGIEWHTNAAFQGRTAADKMFFVRGPSSNGFFGMLGGVTKGGTPYFFFGHNSGNVDNSHTCAADLGLVCNPNVGSSAVPYGTTHKLEVYMKSSTTNTSRDGILRFYVNGVLAGSYSNMNLASAGFNEWNWTETWDNCGGNPVCDLRGSANTNEWSHFVGHLYIATCAGCPVPGGGGGGDTTPPSQVTGLGVSMNGTTATLTYAASTDNVGVTGYLAEKCTPHGCSNWSLAQTSSGLSASISNLTAGVSYDFRVRATDAAGNFGAYSATVTGTTTGEVERTLATDTFDRSNGGLGANWTGSYSGRPDLNLVSNAVRGSSTAGDNLMTYTAIATPADQWAQVDVAVTGSAIYAGGVTLRTAASPLASYYMCRLQANGWAGTMIEKLVNGSYTLLASSAAASWVTGDKLKCTARGSTITLIRIRSGVETVMLTATDSTHTSGKTGIITYTTTLANLIVDNFTTGDWTVAAAPPVIASSATDAAGADLTWAGDPAYIRVQTYTEVGVYSDVVEPIANFPAGRYSQVWALGITSGCFFAQDANHVENTNPNDYRCNTITPAPPADTTPAAISNALPSGVLNVGTTSTQLSVTTNEGAFCHWDTVDVSYGAMAHVFTTAPSGTTHSDTMTGLSDGTSYTLYVRCSDTVNNMNPTSTVLAFSVDSAPAADATPPSTVTGLSCFALSTSQTQCAWTAATDNVSVAGYRLYACQGSGCSEYTLVASPVGTSATVAGLTASTVYGFVVDAVDTSLNLSASHSAAVEVSTSSNLDIVPPSTLMQLREAAPATYNTVSLEWEEGTDNVAISQTLLERCAGSTCEDFETIRSASGTTFSDATVRFGTTYRYRGKHRDTAGNVSTTYSSILSVEVPNPPAGVTSGVCPCKTH